MAKPINVKVRVSVIDTIKIDSLNNALQKLSSASRVASQSASQHAAVAKKNEVDFSTLSQRLNQNQQDLQKISATLDQVKNKKLEYTRSIDAATKAALRESAALEELSQKYAQKAQSLGKASSESLAHQSTVNQLRSSNDTLATSVEKTNAAIKQKEATIAKAETGLGAYIARIGQATLKIAAFMGALYVAKRVLEIFAGIVISIMSPFVKFESTMVKLKIAINATQKEFQELSSLAMEISKTLPIAPIEAAEAMKVLALAGWKANEIMAGFTDIIKASIVMETDFKKTSEIVVTTLAAFNLTADKSKGLLAALSFGADETIRSLEDFGLSLSHSASIASMAGLTYQELIAALVILYKQGFRAEQSGTMLKDTFTHLLAPTEQGTEVMAKYNKSFLDFLPIGQSFEQAILNITNANMKESDMKKLLSVQSYIAIKVLGKHIKEVGVCVDAMKDLEKIEDKLIERSKTLQWKVDMVGASYSRLAITLGEVFGPATAYLIEGFREHIDDLTRDIDNFGILYDNIKKKGLIKGIFEAFPDKPKDSLPKIDSKSLIEYRAQLELINDQITKNKKLQEFKEIKTLSEELKITGKIKEADEELIKTLETLLNLKERINMSTGTETKSKEIDRKKTIDAVNLHIKALEKLRKSVAEGTKKPKIDKTYKEKDYKSEAERAYQALLRETKDLEKVNITAVVEGYKRSIEKINALRKEIEKTPKGYRPEGAKTEKEIKAVSIKAETSTAIQAMEDISKIQKNLSAEQAKILDLEVARFFETQKSKIDMTKKSNSELVSLYFEGMNEQRKADSVSLQNKEQMLQSQLNEAIKSKDLAKEIELVSELEKLDNQKQISSELQKISQDKVNAINEIEKGMLKEINLIGDQILRDRLTGTIKESAANQRAAALEIDLKTEVGKSIDELTDKEKERIATKKELEDIISKSENDNFLSKSKNLDFIISKHEKEIELLQKKREKLAESVGDTGVSKEALTETVDKEIAAAHIEMIKTIVDAEISSVKDLEEIWGYFSNTVIGMFSKVSQTEADNAKKSIDSNKKRSLADLFLSSRTMTAIDKQRKVSIDSANKLTDEKEKRSAIAYANETADDAKMAAAKGSLAYKAADMALSTWMNYRDRKRAIDEDEKKGDIEKTLLKKALIAEAMSETLKAIAKEMAMRAILHAVEGNFAKAAVLAAGAVAAYAASEVYASKAAKYRSEANKASENSIAKQKEAIKSILATEKELFEISLAKSSSIANITSAYSKFSQKAKEIQEKMIRTAATEKEISEIRKEIVEGIKATTSAIADFYEIQRAINKSESYKIDLYGQQIKNLKEIQDTVFTTFELNLESKKVWYEIEKQIIDLIKQRLSLSKDIFEIGLAEGENLNDISISFNDYLSAINEARSELEKQAVSTNEILRLNDNIRKAIQDTVSVTSDYYETRRMVSQEEEYQLNLYQREINDLKQIQGIVYETSGKGIESQRLYYDIEKKIMDLEKAKTSIVDTRFQKQIDLANEELGIKKELATRDNTKLSLLEEQNKIYSDNYTTAKAAGASEDFLNSVAKDRRSTLVDIAQEMQRQKKSYKDFEGFYNQVTGGVNIPMGLDLDYIKGQWEGFADEITEGKITPELRPTVFDYTFNFEGIIPADRAFYEELLEEKIMPAMNQISLKTIR